LSMLLQLKPFLEHSFVSSRKMNYNRALGYSVAPIADFDEEA
jgi:hypothetical protein